MARISFTAIVSEIVGKLAGSVFQYSYGGWQIHTRVSPGNPQTSYQQLRRGWYGFIRANWRNLTNVQRQTFNDNAPSPGQGFNFFTACNINLILVEEPMIDLFTPTATPDQFDFTITAADPDTLSIQASGLITTVPTDTKLLIYATREKPSSAPFTNPSDYSPIISYDEGTDLSSPINAIAAYNSRFGQITGEKYLAMKSVLISKINGTRGAEFLTNTTTDIMPQKYIPLTADQNITNNSGAGETDLYTYTLPADTMINNGDKLKIRIAVGFLTGGSNASLLFYIAGNSFASLNGTDNDFAFFDIDVVRVDNTTARILLHYFCNNVIQYTFQTTQALPGFDTNMQIKFTGNGTASDQVQSRYWYIDQIISP